MSLGAITTKLLNTALAWWLAAQLAAVHAGVWRVDLPWLTERCGRNLRGIQLAILALKALSPAGPNPSAAHCLFPMAQCTQQDAIGAS